MDSLLFCWTLESLQPTGAERTPIRTDHWGLKWSPYADSVRTGLISALRASFGESVRECEWTYIGPGDVYGCRPLVLLDSAQTQ